MIILATAAAQAGNDELANGLVKNARSMGEAMNLFGVLPSSPAMQDFHSMSPDRIRATAHIAWGAYCYLR
jgi:hypothetical protein